MLHRRSHHLASSRLPSASAKQCVLLPRKPAIGCLRQAQIASHFTNHRFINFSKEPLCRHNLSTSAFAPVVKLLFTIQARSLNSK